MPNRTTNYGREGECWAPVPGFGNYEVSTLGSIRHVRFRRDRKLFKSKKGYLAVGLVDSTGKQITRRIHRLVLLAFVGAGPFGTECAHENGDKTDNRLSNLSWKTPVENARDKHRHGTTVFGEKINTARLTTNEVLQIKSELSAGTTDKSISIRYGMSKSAINEVRHGLTWKHIGESGPVGRIRFRLTIDDVREIRAAMKSGDSNRAIAGRFGARVNTIQKIRTGRTWGGVQ